MTNQQTRKLDAARASRVRAQAGELARREDGKLLTAPADGLDLMKLASWGRVTTAR